MDRNNEAKLKANLIVAEAMQKPDREGYPKLTEEHPFFGRLRYFMADKSHWLGTATDLLNAMNDTAIEMILDLRNEFYFGEDSPLIPDGNGNFTRPVNFRKRYYRILKAAGIETKGLHYLRHTFATNLVNGIKQANGTIKSLTPRQVADLLGHTTSEITELYYVKRDLT